MVQGSPQTNRWCFEVLSPVNGTVIWSFQTPVATEISKQWYRDTGNTYLSRAKVKRICNGDQAQPFIRAYKLGKWSLKALDKYGEETDTETETNYSSYATTEATEMSDISDISDVTVE